MFYTDFSCKSCQGSSPGRAAVAPGLVLAAGEGEGSTGDRVGNAVGLRMAENHPFRFHLHIWKYKIMNFTLRIPACREEVIRTYEQMSSGI